MSTQHNPHLSVPRTTEYDWMSIDSWYEKNNAHLELAKTQDVDYLFLGDSITQGWPDDIWQTYFTELNSLNLGIGGDQTQNLLWRIQQPEILALNPKCIILLIGVNNFGHGQQNSTQVANGIQSVVDYILLNFKDTHILLHNVFPAEQLPGADKRQQIIQTNAIVKKKNADHLRITYLEFFDVFLNNKQEIKTEIMEDFLHLTHKGYRIWLRNLLHYLK